jgi:hypothetical protein
MHSSKGCSAPLKDKFLKDKPLLLTARVSRRNGLHSGKYGSTESSHLRVLAEMNRHAYRRNHALPAQWLSSSRAGFGS